MSRKLATNVYVDGSWYGPSDVVPDDVAEMISNPKAWVDGPEMRELDVRKRDDAPTIPEVPQRVELEQVKEPPRGGPGSSADAWRAFMVSQDFEVPEGASAKDMQSAWDNRKV